MICKSSVGKLFKGPMEEEARDLGRIVDLMGSRMDTIVSKIQSGHQLRRDIRSIERLVEIHFLL